MVHLNITLRLLALPIVWVGIVQLVFAALSEWLFLDHMVVSFLIPSLSMLSVGAILYFKYRTIDLSKASYRDALIYATATWIVSGILAAIPIEIIAGVSFTDAVFESISALTTTGATVLSGLDSMPKTFLMYRQFLQWMGGLGIVIFVVAVLPMLNVGGMKLLKAETPGPVKDDKLSPRVSSTAHYLWGVYIFITLACIMAYYIGGMSLFDAVAHSFTTVSTGGFSTHDTSMGYFNSHTLLWISNLFMVLGAINFGLHFRVFRHRDYSGYFRDEETRVFLIIILVLSILVAGYLFFEDTYTNLFESMSYSTFHIISFITSTGYGASGFTEWPAAATCVLIMTGYLGGCAGSTSGGNKIIRNILTVKIFNRSLKQMIHPHGKFAIKYQRSPVQTEVRSAVMAFMSFSAISTIIITLMLMTTGLDFWSSLSAVAACVNVLGPGFGQLGTNFAPVTDAGTWLLSGAMILGRLEYFTVFAIFSPMFWKD